MRHLIIVFVVSGLLLSIQKINAQQATEANMKETGSLNMQGAYSMTRQIMNDGTKDSLGGNEQLKIYTGHYMMYAHPIAGDTLGDYGIGTYKVQDGKVMEYVFYTPSGGAHLDTFALSIKKMDNGYSQIIDFPADLSGRKFLLTEEYKNVGKDMRSPVDGAWKLTSQTYTPMNGSPRTNSNSTQFKVFQSGHYMWANTSMDSTTNKPVSFFGYGTFQMNGNNQLTELTTSSSFTSELVNKPVTLQLEFTGKDSYTQTIIWPNGDRTAEVYQRLK